MHSLEIRNRNKRTIENEPKQLKKTKAQVNERRKTYTLTHSQTCRIAAYTAENTYTYKCIINENEVVSEYATKPAFRLTTAADLDDSV